MSPKLFRNLAITLALMLPSDFAPAQDDFPPIRNNERDTTAQPMSAAEAAAKMKVPPGFSVSVFASEPDVQNPIGMAWDSKGRMWVAENFTYSDRTQRFDLSHRDRVLIFEDKDNDGKADSRRVFTDKVQMLTSVEVGRGGVWLMCPPQLLFVPDAEEDGVPDGPAQVVLDGFTVARNNYHNFANGLRWGPDGWLYGRCGHSCPGRLGVPGTPDELRVPIDGGIWRFHPEHKIVEVLCHGTVNPWGHDWDANGQLFFINTVIGHLWHCIPGAHFKESFGQSPNPHVYDRLDMIADHYHFDTEGKWQDSRDGSANHLGGGHAHIGMMIYQGKTWPQQYRNKLLTLNMHGQRTNVERLERVGAGYVGYHEPDVFIAADPFYRGIDLSTGPDGNVFILDWSDTGECHDHTGVHRTSGRIFKVSYDKNADATGDMVSKPACLVGDGDLSKLWRRYQAGKTTPEELRGLLSHQNEHVRVWAIRLLTDLWPMDTLLGPLPNADYPKDPETRRAFRRMAREDKSGLVHLTLASTLQRMSPRHRGALASELMKHRHHANDRDLPSLVWFGLIPLAEKNIDAMAFVPTKCEWPRMYRWITRYLAERGEPGATVLNEVIRMAVNKGESYQKEVLVGMSRAFKGRRKVAMPASWKQLSTTPGAKSMPAVVRGLSTVFGDGRALADIQKLAFDRSADLETRRSALRTLISARPRGLRKLLESAIKDRAINGEAAKGLALYNDPAIGEKLATSFTRFHPDDRPAVLSTLVSRKSFAHALLNRIGTQKGQLPATTLSAFHARQIRGLGDDSLNRKLSAVWGELRDSPADRKALMAEYRKQLTPDVLAKADLSNGRHLFQKTCSACHKLYEAGKQIGPTLTGSQRSSLDYLLENILDPSAVVGKDYRMTVVLMDDGRILNGLTVSQNGSRLVLQTPTDLLTLSKDEIDEISQKPLSPMPDGLLQTLKPDEVRDLIGYLMHPVQVELPK
ncbi:MAG: PVC-type heme-binding CxxCH protein [Planctomycetaceae bacterium]